jgi:hypothetical protein
VVSAVRVAVAAIALLFDVDDFACAAYIAISAHDASARQRGKTEKSNNAHKTDLPVPLD